MRIGIGNDLGLIRIILCVCLLVWACDNDPPRPVSEDTQEQTTPKSGGTYRLPLTQNPASLDPALVQDAYGNTVVQQIFDGLVRFGPYLTPHPALAETWRIEDNSRVYIFTLRQNVRFHNGQTVTVADVIFSLSRLLRVDPPPFILPHLLKIEGAAAYRKRRADNVSGLKVMGDHMLQVRLNEPHVPFLAALGMYQAKIVPRQAVMADSRSFGGRPIGSGPYRFLSWETGKSIRLQRFDNHYGGKSLLDEIHYRIYTTRQQQRMLEDFSSGELEEMPVFSDEVKTALAGRPDLQWFHRPSLSLFFYGINCRKAPLNDPKLRRRLSAAISRSQLVEEVFNGRFETAHTLLPPGMPGYRPPASPLDAQPAEDRAPDARQTLATIEIVSAYDSPRVRQEMTLVRKSWQRLGIELTTKFITDWDAFNAYIRSDAVQIYRYNWTADMPDPDSILHPLFASDSLDNHMGFHDALVDNLLHAARGKIDPVARTEVYREAERLILKSAPLIPLFHLSVDRVYQASVMDAQPSALGAHTMPLHKVWLKRDQ